MSATAFLKNSILILLAFLFFSCDEQQKVKGLPYYNTPDFTPQFLSKEDADKNITHVIAPFYFINENAKPFTDKDIKGKIQVANFIFTSCGSICPVMTDQMNRVAKAFNNDAGVAILSYSVTPWIDTPEKLKAYKENKGITNNNWHFLTGNKASIYRLARQSYFAEEDLGFTKDSTEFLHTEHFILVDKHKHIRGIYNGTLQLDVEQLIKDIVLLKQEE